jgi:hypothetical protein
MSKYAAFPRPQVLAFPFALALALLAPAPRAGVAIPTASAAAATFGPPCLCFPLRCADGPLVPENALDKPGWSAERLADETLKLASSSPDPFARAESLRRALHALHSLRETSKGDLQPWVDRLGQPLELNLKREAELAPLSRATLVPAAGAEIDAASQARMRTAIAALAGVKRVEWHAGSAGVVAWFDAAQVAPRALAAAAGLAGEPRVETPNPRAHALAALALAYAGEGARQLGCAVEFDPLDLARQAAALQPNDARIALVAGMIVFDRDAKGAAQLGQHALRLGRGDELVEHNLHAIYRHFYAAETLDELGQALERRLARE